MSRIENSLKNIKYSLAGQILSMLAKFLTRMFFVRILSMEYLGLNGLFTNILSILSLAELGLGSAIVYSMYKPLAENDIDLLAGIMKLYKKAYIFIGIIILTFGLSLTPFLEIFIKEIPEIRNLELIYVLFVVNTASSYFFSYKRSLLIADQKKYIDSIYYNTSILVSNILQILILVLTRNFILYLLVQIIVILIENIMISRRIDYLYSHILKNKDSHLSSEVKISIIKNVKAMFNHKIGSVIVMSTDNLLISRFVGLIQVGLYSNYLLIISALRQAFDILFQSMVASIGNLGATESTEKNEFIFRCLDFLGLWVYGFASIALISLFNPFIDLWLGKGYLFSTDIVIMIVLSFYLWGRRRSVLSFRDALGLFWYDRYKPIIESFINLAVSLILVFSLGIKGIILGTIISTITTSFWVEPYVLYKYGFKLSVKGYFIKYVLWTAVIFTICIINTTIISLLSDSLAAFMIKILITAIIPNFLIIVIFWRTKEFQYLYKIIAQTLKKKFK